MLTVKKVASVAGVSAGLVYIWIGSGVLPHYRVGRPGCRGGIRVAEADLEAFLESAWLAGTRSGHAKLLNQAIRQREESADEELETPLVPVQMQDLEAEFKAMMEASAEALDLSMGDAVALWDIAYILIVSVLLLLWARAAVRARLVDSASGQLAARRRTHMRARVSRGVTEPTETRT